MEFYEKLQELRKSRELTQEELAEMLYCRGGRETKERLYAEPCFRAA